MTGQEIGSPNHPLPHREVVPHRRLSFGGDFLFTSDTVAVGSRIFSDPTINVL